MTTAQIRTMISDFRWVHTGLGLIGNTSFFIGSIFFLWDGALQKAGVWLFIAGALGMMLGSIGEAIVKYERHELNI